MISGSQAALIPLSPNSSVDTSGNSGGRALRRFSRGQVNHGHLNNDMANRGRVQSLRARIGAIERPDGFGSKAAPPVPFGVAAIDSALPWGGLPRNCLHEISGEGAAVGFAAALLGRFAGTDGMVLWCQRAPGVFDGGGLHGPGLVPFGLDPNRLVLVRAHSSDDLLWAMEEALRSGRPAAVLGEVGGIGLVASRRLQLAAETFGVTAFLWRRTEANQSAKRNNNSVAITRWHLRSAAGEGSVVTPGRWRAALVRCRGARPHSWPLEWNAAQQIFETQSQSETNGPDDVQHDCTGGTQRSRGLGENRDANPVAVLATVSDRPVKPVSARVLRHAAS
jgi:protein ImuA